MTVYIFPFTESFSFSLLSIVSFLRKMDILKVHPNIEVEITGEGRDQSKVSAENPKLNLKYGIGHLLS